MAERYGFGATRGSASLASTKHPVAQRTSLGDLLRANPWRLGTRAWAWGTGLHRSRNGLDSDTPMAQDLFEPLHHALRRGVLRIDDERSPRHRERPDLVAPLERDARQADGRDRVAGIRSRALPVELLGAIEQPDRQRPFRLQQDLDHPSAAVSARARRSKVGRSLSSGSAITRSRSASRMRPRIGPGERPSSSMRSVPSTARPRRSSTASAWSSAAIRARSSPSQPAPAPRPDPTLSASRSASSSLKAPSPDVSIRAMNRRTAASDQPGS